MNRQQRSSLIWLVAAIAVGFALRFYALGAKGLFFDEALSWRLQQMPLPMLVQRTGEPTTTHPPLYFIALRYWTRCFGDSEAAMRSLAVVAGVLTIPSIWFLVYQLNFFAPSRAQAQKWGLVPWSTSVVAWLLALSPLHIYMAKQVRGYTLAVMFFVIGSSALLAALRERAGKRSFFLWMLYAWIMAACCYTHYLGLFSTAGQLVFAASYLAFGRSSRTPQDRTTACAAVATADKGLPTPGERKFISAWCAMACAVLIIIAIYAPWAARLWQQSENSRLSWHIPLIAQQCPAHVYEALFGTPGFRQTMPGVLEWTVTVAACVLLAVVVLRLGWAGLFCGLAVGIPIGLILLYYVFSHRSLFGARYLVFSQTAFLAAAALAVGTQRHAFERWLASLFLVGCLSYGLFDNWQLLGKDSLPGFRGVANYILQNRAGHETVVCTNPLIFFPIAYYMRHQPPGPVLLATDADRREQRAAAHLLQEDLATGSQVARAAAMGIWVVTGPGMPTLGAFPLAGNWQILERQQFVPELNSPPQDVIVVYHWRSGK